LINNTDNSQQISGATLSSDKIKLLYETGKVHRASESPIQLDTDKQARTPDRNFTEVYSQKLATWTHYKPKVIVLVVTMLRPYFLDECLKRIFQSITPLKVRLVNQGDQSDEMLDVLKKRRSRWDVDYIYNEHPRSMAEIRSEAFTWAKQEGYKFAITVDDDMLVMPGALDELVKIARKNPQFHAIAGYCIEPGIVRMLGGTEKVLNGSYFHFNLPYTKGLKEVNYVSSGLRIVRLDPLILQDTDYDFGWIDWDYSKRVKQAGLKLAVTGKVGGYHGMMQIDGKWRARPDPEAYARIRLDEDRMEIMTQLFEGKWGLKVAREKPSLTHRILFRAQWELGTISYRSACFYERFIHRKKSKKKIQDKNQ